MKIASYDPKRTIGSHSRVPFQGPVPRPGGSAAETPTGKGSWPQKKPESQVVGLLSILYYTVLYYIPYYTIVG